VPAPDPRPPLKVVAVSGSALPGGLASTFMDVYGDVLYNLYGSTEVSWASIAAPQDLRQAPTTAGRPPHGTRLEMLDDDGQPVPNGQVGRIFVGNEMLFEGPTARPVTACSTPATSAGSTRTVCSSSTAGPTT
jgi:acyl-coenzyme A synthetase/AMP-(fatty) acid ligase